MKKVIILLITVIIAAGIMLFILLTRSGDTPEPSNFPKPRNGVAVIMTGAAARIPQEAALLEELYKRGLLKNLVFISGVSSGALNAVALNGILSKRMTWNEYKQILYSLKNSNIFIQEGKKLPLNTSPARELFQEVFEKKLRYHKIGDLPFCTSISFTQLKRVGLKNSVYRMCSRKINEETDTTLSLVDIVMASTAFPVAFPAQKIKGPKTIPDVEYIDGGIGDDHVPYKALLEFEKFRGAGVEKVYIISRKSDDVPQISDELKGLGIDDDGFFNKMGISLDVMLKNGIYNRMEAFAREAPDLIPRTYVWIPEFQENFLLMNFDDLKAQYELTSKWAKKHDPVPLNQYMLDQTRNLK